MKKQSSTLTHLFMSVLLILLALLACPAIVRAEDTKNEAATSDWDGTIVVRTTGNQRDSYKFLEYRTMPAAGVDSLNYYYESGAKDRSFNLGFSNIGRDDGNYTLGFNGYGKWKLEVGYDNILHRFGYDNRTLYDGVGTNNLTINPTRKAPWLTAATRTDGNFIRDAYLFDPQLVRRKYSLGLDLFEDKPLNLRLDFSSEDRSGTRPFGANFGFSLANESPEPIGYTTTNFSALLELPKSEKFYGAIGYSVSNFTNRNDTLLFENPTLNADSYTAPTATSNASSVAWRGRTDLYPNNQATNLSLNLAFKDLFWHGRLNIYGAWGSNTQSSNLLPYSTNGRTENANLIGTTMASQVNLGSVDARVSTDTLNITWTARPKKHISLSAKYYHYGWTNNTAVRTLNYVAGDAFPSNPNIYFPNGTAIANNVNNRLLVQTEPANWTSDNFEFNLGFDLASASHLNLAYIGKSYTRTKLESSNSYENGIKVTFDTAPSDWFSFRAGYEKLARRNDYNYTAPALFAYTSYNYRHIGVAPIDPPTLRKFDQANRDRDVFNAEASFWPSKKFNFSLSYNSFNNVYPDSGYGRSRDNYNIFAIDAELTPSDRCRVNAFYNAEQFSSSQRSREWGNTTVNAANDPVFGNGNPFTSTDPRYDWVADSTDTTYTLGVGFWANLRPNKLDMNIDYRSSISNGSIRLPNGAHLTTAAAAWTPRNFDDVDDITYTTLDVQFTWRLKKENTFTLGWLMENYQDTDFSNVGWKNIPTTTAGAFNSTILAGGSLIPSYSANTLYVKYGFKL